MKMLDEVLMIMGAAAFGYAVRAKRYIGFTCDDLLYLRPPREIGGNRVLYLIAAFTLAMGLALALAPEARGQSYFGRYPLQQFGYGYSSSLGHIYQAAKADEKRKEAEARYDKLAELAAQLGVTTERIKELEDYTAALKKRNDELEGALRTLQAYADSRVYSGYSYAYRPQPYGSAVYSFRLPNPTMTTTVLPNGSTVIQETESPQDRTERLLDQLKAADLPRRLSFGQGYQVENHGPPVPPDEILYPPHDNYPTRKIQLRR